MAISIKTQTEIEIMRKAGKVLAKILNQLAKEVKPGVSTKYLDQTAADLCKLYQVKAAFLGYNNYPAHICVGVDDVAVHGIPSDTQILKSGQIVSIDMGVIMQGYYSDSAITVAVGQIDQQAQRLLDVTRLALKSAIAKAVEGNRVGDISNTIEEIATLSGFSVIEDLTGHGIGKALHEEPAVPCFGQAGTGSLLKAGMALAIEPMINQGSADLIFEADGWTTRTADGKLSAIFEHTVIVGKKQAEVLTIE